MRGSATFTTAASSTTMSWATRTRAMPMRAAPAGCLVGGATVAVEDMRGSSCSDPVGSTYSYGGSLRLSRGSGDTLRLRETLPETFSVYQAILERVPRKMRGRGGPGGRTTMRADAQRNRDRL